jgi:3-oxoacyl-[acyl-carrier protein] reductase
MKKTNSGRPSRVVFITGASRAIGRATAELFARDGYDLALHCHVLDREEHELLKLLKEKYGVKAEFFAADFSNMKQVKKLLAGVYKKFGRVDVLVNNAGSYPEHDFFQSSEKAWDYLMSVNLKAHYFISQHVSAKMLENKIRGNIINIASVAGLYPRKTNLEYALAKAALIHFSKSLAILLAPQIRVNAIAPSYTWSGFMSMMKKSGEVKKRMKIIPLKRFNMPEDIAEAVSFLSSEKARNVTGQVLVIDGGRGAAV